MKRADWLVTLGALAIWSPAFLTSVWAQDDAWFTRGKLDIDFSDESNTGTWEGEWFIGGDFNKLRIESEGETLDDDVEESDVRLLYSRYIARFWDAQLGYRREFDPNGVNSFVFGLQGVAPYWFETEVAMFLDEDSEFSGEIELAYDLLFTQRLIAEPYVNADWNGFSDRVRNIGSGFSFLDYGIKLRYEFVRQFALYLDFNRRQFVGETRDIVTDAGEDGSDNSLRLGMRLVF